MKRLILFANALLFSLSLVNGQTPGKFATYVYDDFQQVAQYTNADGSGIYWYSGSATAVNGTRTVGKMTMTYSSATTYNFISADFGQDASSNLTPIDATSMADIQVDIKNTNATKDLQMRLYLKDVNNKYLEIEPNISDAVAAPDFATPTPGIAWSASNLVYPAPAGYPGNTAVYPYVGFNGFVIPANTRKTYRIDLSSVSATMGGRAQGTYGGTKPGDSPNSITAAADGFDITKVHVVEFVFNEGVAFNLTDGAINKGSYKYDAIGINQTNYTGTIEFYSLKIGSILSALPADPDLVTGLNKTMINNSLSVYPNPAKDALNVSFEAAGGAAISLSDIVGKTVYSSSASAGSNNLTVNTSGFSSGIYILNIVTENGTVARKVTIE
ncbi:MAG TPA: T9SS type A sorting domain-containing protein [Cytophagaceae bacterium]|jgi:hypothetical protein|nr:T9SS type A sorting domain-containing protein [Cytophagaceae bacterium]